LSSFRAAVIAAHFLSDRRATVFLVFATPRTRHPNAKRLQKEGRHQRHIRHHATSRQKAQ
jgi:hypothetical protein